MPAPSDANNTDFYSSSGPKYNVDDQNRWYIRDGRGGWAPYLEGDAGMGRAVHSVVDQNGRESFVYGSEGADSRIAALRDRTSADANAYNWGGTPEGAANDRETMRRWAETMANRAAPTIDQTAQNASRGIQMAGAQGYQDMMAGNGPSLANYQMQAGLDRAAGAASAAQASASPSNRVAAMRAGLMGANSAGIQGATDATAQRFGEFSQAASGLAGIGSNMYGADYKNAAAQADMMLRNRAANDEASAGFTQMGINVGRAQMGAQADLQRQRQRIQDLWDSKQNADYNSSSAKAKRTRDTLLKAGATTGGAVAGAVTGGPAGAVAGGATGYGLANAATS